MELEDLKNIWKRNETSFRPKDEREIAAMLKGTSMSIICKLKRSVWFELILTVVAVMALAIKSITLPQGALKWTSISILVILCGYSFYYIKKLMLLKRFDSPNENIRTNLKRLTESLTGYLKFYKRSYAILSPVYFFLGLLFVGLEKGTAQFFESLTKPRNLLIIIVIASTFFACSKWLVDWLLKKLYGNHLQKLKSLLDDLENR